MILNMHFSYYGVLKALSVFLSPGLICYVDFKRVGIGKVNKLILILRFKSLRCLGVRGYYSFDKIKIKQILFRL